METQLITPRFEGVPCEENLITPTNRKYDRFMRKPTCGLWTSTWDAEKKSSHWVDWCLAEDFHNPYNLRWFLLEVEQNARVFHLDGITDLKNLIRQYHLGPQVDGVIDFEAFFKDYDGLHLTKKGNQRLHWRSDTLDLNAWDVESTVWGRWVFASVTEVTDQVILDGKLLEGARY